MTSDRNGAAGPRPARREHALWGLVGALAFLVLAQGYRLVTDGGPGLVVLLPVAVVVGILAGALTYAARRAKRTL